MYDTDVQIEKVSEELAIAFVRNWGFKESPDKLARRFLHAKKEIESTIKKEQE